MEPYNHWRSTLRYGGSWWIRLPVRFILLGLIVSAGYAPYQHEVGGECRVVAQRQAALRAPISDEIEAFHVQQGSQVDAGDPVVTFRAHNERAELKMAEAELKRMQARLQMLRSGSRPEDLEMARQKVELWQVQLAFQKAKHRRTKALYEKGVAQEEELEQAEKAVDASSAMLHSSRENLAKVQAGTREERIAAATAEVEEAEAKVALKKELLALSQIDSPIAGTITTANLEAHIGQTVRAGDVVAVVQDVSELHVLIAADETAVKWVKTGAEVDVRLNGHNGQLVNAVVKQVDLIVRPDRELDSEPYRTDRETQRYQMQGRPTDDRYLRVLAAVERDDQRSLKPGMTGYARISVKPDYFGNAVARPVLRFFRVEVWSWLP